MFKASFPRSAWCQRIFSLKPEDFEGFNLCALELFFWQKKNNPAYRSLIKREYPLSQECASWREIPAIPQSLFKSMRIASHPKVETRVTFLSSGTTDQQRSQHHLRSLDIYQFSCTTQVPLFTAAAPESRRDHPTIDLHFLAPSPEEAPHSSLSQMFAFWKKAYGTSASRFWVTANQLEFKSLRRALEKSLTRGKPLGILGTAFSFVHLLDAFKGLSLSLPPGSFLLETGGFKGRSREIRKPTFYRQLGRLFQVPDEEIWNEYGMCELSSQAYARGARGEHQIPPWTRVMIMDPATNREVKIGQRGLVRWIDLANVDSVLALQTHDVARRTPTGFQLIGRLPHLPRRGCSLTAEEFRRS